MDKAVKHIQIINGPNLNLLGKRETEIYGDVTFDIFLEKIKKDYPNVSFSYYQSNVEGEIINCLQDVDKKVDGIILNAGGYTHTSVAIRDAVAAIDTGVVEVHLSNIAAREEFRHTSLISPVCKGCITGFGFCAYILALQYFMLS